MSKRNNPKYTKHKKLKKSKTRWITKCTDGKTYTEKKETSKQIKKTSKYRVKKNNKKDKQYKALKLKDEGQRRWILENTHKNSLHRKDNNDEERKKTSNYFVIPQELKYTEHKNLRWSKKKKEQGNILMETAYTEKRTMNRERNDQTTVYNRRNPKYTRHKN